MCGCAQESDAVTMELSVSLEEHLRQSAMLHSRLCPRQVLGVRMARFACRWFGIDPALERRQIFVYMEIGRCAADGVMVVTCASPTNQLMQLIPYGKVAATFVHLRTGDSLRVSEHPGCREAALVSSDGSCPPWERQLQAYQTLPDDRLLRYQKVKLQTPVPTIPEKYSISCSACGDRVNEHQEVSLAGNVLCKACALGAYYEEAEFHQALDMVQAGRAGGI
jgi:formylmethanofuran dehydrogenase subunit E